MNFGDFLEANKTIIILVHGQALFLMGALIALSSRRTARSRLGGAMWLLAAFGLSHGLSEWGEVYLSSLGRSLPGYSFTLAMILEMVISAVSFAFLFQFGAELVVSSRRKSYWLLGLPLIIFSTWVAMTSLAGIFSHQPQNWLTQGSIGAGYLLGLPGTILACYGLYLQAGDSRELGMARLSDHLRWAIGGLALYGVTEGFIFPTSALFAYLGKGIPFDVGSNVYVRIFLAGCVLAISYGFIRALNIIESETSLRNHLIEVNQAVAAERRRIGRDLHDNIIQSIFATGLSLEEDSYDISDKKERKKLQENIAGLNDIISKIRSSIFNLQPLALENKAFSERFADLVNEFKLNSGLITNLNIQEKIKPSLSADAAVNLLYIAREALTNISKHASAKSVDINLLVDKEELILEIADDGMGFDPAEVSRDSEYKYGLKNMADRIRILDGILKIDSARGRGTRIIIKIPSLQETAR